jgi:hypothetical protein
VEWKQRLSTLWSNRLQGPFLVVCLI